MRWVWNEGERQVVEAADAAALTHNLNLDPPVEHLRMMWAIGLNYRDHVAETGTADPDRADGVREVDGLASSATAPTSSSRRTSPNPTTRASWPS